MLLLALSHKVVEKQDLVSTSKTACQTQGAETFHEISCHPPTINRGKTYSFSTLRKQNPLYNTVSGWGKYSKSFHSLPGLWISKKWPSPPTCLAHLINGLRSWHEQWDRMGAEINRQDNCRAMAYRGTEGSPGSLLLQRHDYLLITWPAAIPFGISVEQSCFDPWKLPSPLRAACTVWAQQPSFGFIILAKTVHSPALCVSCDKNLPMADPQLHLSL